MLTAEEVAQFHRDGYLKGGKVLGDEEVALMQEEVMRVIGERGDATKKQPVMCHNMGKPEAPVWQIVNIWEASRPFAKLIRHSRITEEIAQLTDAAAVRIWHDQIQFKPAATGGVNMWHQDHPYWPILNPPVQVTAWVALDDVDAGNGCMSMVPGSHLWGNHIEFLQKLPSFDAMPGEHAGHKLEVRLAPVKRGEVHFHHGLTWHGSHANTSGRPRRAVALHYMPGGTRFVASGTHVMKKFVGVADGEELSGEHFPVVWQKK